MIADVRKGEKFFKVGDHEEQLFVILVAQESFNWYSVRQVEGERDDGIVYNDHIFDVPVGDDR